MRYLILLVFVILLIGCSTQRKMRNCDFFSDVTICEYNES